MWNDPHTHTEHTQKTHTHTHRTYPENTHTHTEHTQKTHTHTHTEHTQKTHTHTHTHTHTEHTSLTSLWLCVPGTRGFRTPGKSYLKRRSVSLHCIRELSLLLVSTLNWCCWKYGDEWEEPTLLSHAKTHGHMMVTCQDIIVTCHGHMLRTSHFPRN